MNLLIKNAKSERGFSLIELMIVVAIIGILATVAIPNFQRFQAKARQADVKTSLGAIYTAEMAFNSEFQGYTTSFTMIGYSPAGTHLYDAGFGAATTAQGTAYSAAYTGALPGAPNPTSAEDLNISGCATVPTLGVCQSTIYSPACKTTTTIAAQVTTSVAINGFLAGSVGCPNAGSNTLYDTWTMNNTNSLNNPTSGL